MADVRGLWEDRTLMVMDPHLRDVLAKTLPAELFREVVEAEPSVAGDWVARSRAFALFEPVRSAATFLRASIRRRKEGDGGRPLERYDFEGLLLEAIDRVVDHYGLGESLATSDLVAHLAEHVAQMERAVDRAPDVEWCAAVAEDAVAVLLNRRERVDDIIESPHTAYVHRHLVPGPAPRVVPFAFLLLEEATDSGRRVVRARQEAVLFTVRMLDFDLEEMGEVLEALLERQMQRGNFEGARRTAENGRKVAKSWAAKIRAQLDEARRRPLATGYARQLAPILDAARKHLGERVTRERDLRDTVERLRWQASEDVHLALDAIEGELSTCSRVYAALARAIAEAPGEHEARRARALVGRVAPGTYPDPLDGVLVPALRLPALACAAGGPELVRRVLGPSRVRPFDLASFVTTAFRPEAPPRQLDLGAPEEPIEFLAQPSLPVEAARGLVERSVSAAGPAGVWLAAILAAAEPDLPLQTAVVLVTHLARLERGHAPTAWAVAEVGPRRRVGAIELEDLRLVASVPSPVHVVEVAGAR